MKLVYYGLFLFMSVEPVYGQADTGIETSDLPIDRVLTKQLRLPDEVFRLKHSIRLYVYFTITSEGTYTNVSIVNNNPVHESFHPAIANAWRKLPRETGEFAGNYVVPIAFMFGEGGPDKLKPIWNIADGMSRDRPFKLLKEIPVIGYIVCIKRSL
ncbi:MAG: hypothetical protein EOO39_10355 [Cytophagaceae bacterium]|nr:MAG: hypothetical protein EOO39_10355 [Cytophagaceae bacterium]